MALIMMGALLAASPTPDENKLPIRAVWVTRWGFKTSGDVERLFRDLESIGVNTVFFQVRGACDGLYESKHEPWSSVLTGQLGEHPGWDPLGIAVKEAHRRGMALHAWINVFPAWPVSDKGDPPPETSPLHVMIAHPDWLAVDRSGRAMSLKASENRHSYAFLSPTHEEVQDHIGKIVEDIARRYEIDGLHLDYVRFPDSSYSYDLSTRASYLETAKKQGAISFEGWRRKSLTELVGTLAYTARLTRPGIKVSAAVWQKIESGKIDYFQDGIEWMKRGYTDFLVPMIYTTDIETFEVRLKSYTELADPSNVVAGMGPYLEAFNDSIFAGQLDVAGRYGVRGISVFNSDYAIKYSCLIRAYSAESDDR